MTEGDAPRLGIAEPWRADFDAVIGLGSNVGDKPANLARAIELLTAGGEVKLVRLSGIYRTAPWGKVDQDWFANACATVRTGLPALALLRRCLAVEETLKRVRQERWGPRIIDVDVLVYRDEVSSGPELILPHPRITERAFVLVPMAEVAPAVRIGGKTIVEWRDATDSSEVVGLH
ncbi:MAG: 2-amino-4-hydroxy-6-hydroxymethyldihydropteridine diphosphokinase [Hyphomicrobium sp.]|jgi:2-amino-4-hydroxy-6-hydroxymethyldihydropteridine diphosphokinase